MKNKPKIDKSTKLIVYISFLDKNKDLKKNIDIIKEDILNISTSKIEIDTIDINIIKIKINIDANTSEIGINTVNTNTNIPEGIKITIIII